MGLPSPWVYKVDYAADLIPLISELGPKNGNSHGNKQLYIYGHSLGALLALRLAASHPNTICGVVAEDPRANFTKHSKPRSVVQTFAAMRQLGISTCIPTVCF